MAALDKVLSWIAFFTLIVVLIIFNHPGWAVFFLILGAMEYGS